MSLTDRQLDRMSFQMFVIYIRYAGEKKFFPFTDIHGNAVAYHNRDSAATELYRLRELNGQRSAKLIKVGPIS